MHVYLCLPMSTHRRQCRNYQKIKNYFIINNYEGNGDYFKIKEGINRKHIKFSKLINNKVLDQ